MDCGGQEKSPMLRKEATRSLVVRQQILVDLLSDGSRVNRLWLGWLFGLCADISPHQYNWCLEMGSLGTNDAWIGFNDQLWSPPVEDMHEPYQFLWPCFPLEMKTESMNICFLAKIDEMVHGTLKSVQKSLTKSIFVSFDRPCLRTWFCQTWDLSAGTSSESQPSTATAAEASPHPANTTSPVKVKQPEHMH